MQCKKTSNIETHLSKNKPCLFKPSKTKTLYGIFSDFDRALTE